jgi:DNA/RNA endonuclease YhcR with UshA esterase domain
MRRTALALSALALTSTAVNGQGYCNFPIPFEASFSPLAVTLGVYTFTGAAGDEATFPVDAQPANGTFSPMRRGGGLTPSLSANRFSATGWTMATAPDTAQYFSFRLTTANGFQADLDSLVFDERRSATGVHRWEVRSSFDGFTSAIAGDSIPDDTEIRTRRIPLIGGFDAASNVEFRIYGFGAEAAAGTWRMDNVRLVGIIAPAGAAVPTVSFASSALSANEGSGTITIPVTIANPSATAATTVEVMLGTTGTATSGTDFTFAPATQTLTFPAGSTAAQNVTVTLIDDAATETPETVGLMLMNPSTGAVLGTPATLTLTIVDNDSTTGPTQNPPLETIAAVTGNDAAGVASRLNDTVRVRGVVTGPNTRTVGFSFSIQDATGGVLIFSSGAVGTVTAVQPGDQVEVIGHVTQFNGLTELVPDSIYQIATGQPLPTPRVVTVLDESTENEVVQIVGPLTLPTPSQWVAAGSGFNVDATDGTNTYQLRIVRGTDLYNAPAPTQPFSVIGVGGQFDNATPFLEGYQLMPRFLTDIVVDTTAGMPRVQFGAATASVREGNVSVSVSVTLVNPDTTLASTTVDVQLATTGTATNGADFNFAPITPTLTFARGVLTQTVNVDILDDATVEANETVVLNLLNATGAMLGTPATYTLTITDNDTTGTNPQTPPLRPIADVVVTDAQGVATLDGQAVRIRGIVTSPNIRTAGYSVTMQDASGWGITVFRSAAVGTQVLNQGDEVEVVGIIDQFNGLTEIIPDSFRTVATNQVIPTPRVTSVLNESTESLLVKINGPLTIPNPTQWTNAAGGFTVDVTDGTTTYALRVPRGSALIGTAAPTQPFRLTGTGGQFDNAAPFLEGYQIQPRTTGDIELVNGVRDEQATAAVTLFPNPASDRLTINAPAALTTATVIDALGRTVRTVALTGGTASVEVSALTPGVYSVRVGAGVKRFVKQ